MNHQLISPSSSVRVCSSPARGACEGAACCGISPSFVSESVASTSSTEGKTFRALGETEPPDCVELTGEALEVGETNGVGEEEGVVEGVGVEEGEGVIGTVAAKQVVVTPGDASHFAERLRLAAVAY